MEARLQILSGTSNPKLTSEITEILGVPVGRANVSAYADGETRVRLDEHVRGSDVYVVQTLCPPVDHHIFQMLLLVDAVRRCSASRVTAVVPYLAYTKQEKKTAGAREPISAKLLANLMATAGVDRLLTVDLHSAAIEGFFDIPVDHLRIPAMLADYFEDLDLEDPVIVAPDPGGVARANDLRERLGGSLAIIYRQGPTNQSDWNLEMVGTVEGRPAIIVDDRIATGSTLLSTVSALRERGASAVYASATHALFTPDALHAVEESDIERMVVTNTVPVPEGVKSSKLDILSIGPLVAESILRIHKDISLSSLFG